MIKEYATAEDFTRWEEHASGLDSWTIKYIVEDCRKAASAISGHNTIREGYYIDQGNTYAHEIMKRKMR